MASSVLYMSMSLDGFIAGPNVGPGNGLGDGGMRLHEWVFPQGMDGDHHDTAGLAGINKQVIDEMMTTGAVVAGRGTFEPAEGWHGDHHDGVPIWILSRHPAPAWSVGWPNVHFTNDLAAAMAAAKQAAGNRNVLVHGSGVAQRALGAGLLDELQLHVVPVLFGGGTRLFEHLDIRQQELETMAVLAGEGGMVHLRYRLRPRERG